MVLIDVESENGWRPASLAPSDPLLVWKTIPGTNGLVTVQVMRGLPEIFLPAWLADWHAYIEPLEDDTTASYTDGNSVYTSNHKNGTAVDADWEKHPFETRGTFNAAQMIVLRQMIDFYEGWIFWAGDWDDPVDEMHSQMGYNTWNRNTAALDFISRKIRSDGFSTFRRGALASNDPPNFNGTPVAPTPDTPSNPAQGQQGSTDSPAQVLYDAVPVINLDTATALVDRIVIGLDLCKAKTVNSIAMWLAQVGEESGGFIYTEEIAKNGPYAPYIGRTWIQITWDYNYRAFGAWCVEQGLATDPDQFFNNPQSLADDKWAALGPAWYCTIEQPLFMYYSEIGDVENASKAINAPAWIGDPTKRANGIQDRIDRYNQAHALGDRLLLLVKNTTSTGDGPLDALTPEEQHKLLDDVAEIRAQLNGDAQFDTGTSAAAVKRVEDAHASGKPMSLLDMLTWVKNHVSTHKAPTP